MATPPIRTSPRTGLPLIPREPARRTARCSDPAPDGLRAGIALFNRGEYWECHEALEDAWRAEPDPVRYLYQGILLAGVGLLHARRSNRRGAIAKLRAGHALLEPYAPACMGVDVGALRSDILRVLAYLDTIAEGATIDLPPELAPLIRLAPLDSTAGAAATSW
jgi:uncharacterized protein